MCANSGRGARELLACLVVKHERKGALQIEGKLARGLARQELEVAAGMSDDADSLHCGSGRKRTTDQARLLLMERAGHITPSKSRAA